MMSWFGQPTVCSGNQQVRYCWMLVVSSSVHTLMTSVWRRISACNVCLGVQGEKNSGLLVLCSLCSSSRLSLNVACRNVGCLLYSWSELQFLKRCLYFYEPVNSATQLLLKCFVAWYLFWILCCAVKPSGDLVFTAGVRTPVSYSLGT